MESINVIVDDVSVETTTTKLQTLKSSNMMESDDDHSHAPPK